MSDIQIADLPAELAERLLALFPGAAVVAADLCTVRCESVFRNDRFGGTARLGTCPTSARLVEDLKAWRAADARLLGVSPLHLIRR